MKQYEIRRLLSICPHELMDDFNKLVDDVSKFEIEQCNLQLDQILNKPQKLGKEEFTLLSEKEFEGQVVAFDVRYAALSDNVFCEIRRAGERFNQRKNRKRKARENWKLSHWMFKSIDQDK